MIKRLRSRHKKWIPVAAIILLALVLMAMLAKTSRASTITELDWTMDQVRT